MPLRMTNFSRFSIFDLRNLCEIAGIDPDGHRRESKRARRKESLRRKVRPDVPKTLTLLEQQAAISSITLLPSE
jgi:hypothetical protein